MNVDVAHDLRGRLGVMPINKLSQESLDSTNLFSNKRKYDIS